MERIKNIRGMVKEGNTCLFAVFFLFNFLLFLSSLGLLGVAIYLFVFTKQANVFNISFTAIAVVLVIFSCCAFRMRRSIHLLGFYLFILTIIFLAQATLTICIVAFKSQLIERAKEVIPGNESLDIAIEELNTHFKEVSLALFIFLAVVVRFLFLNKCCVQGMTLATGMCYRCSTKTKTFKAKENLLNEERYSESVKKLEAVAQASQEKRLYYEQKYPDLKQYSMNSGGNKQDRNNSLK